jgi:hypothetical protein
LPAERPRNSSAAEVQSGHGYPRQPSRRDAGVPPGQNTSGAPERDLPLIAGGQIAPAHDRACPLEQAPEALRHLIEDRPFGTVTLTVDALSIFLIDPKVTTSNCSPVITHAAGPDAASRPPCRQTYTEFAGVQNWQILARLPRQIGIPWPFGRNHIPHAEIEELVRKYLGPTRRAGQSTAPVQALSLQDALASTRFGAPRVTFAPGIPDLMRDIESVVSGYFSMSYAAPHLFGDRVEEFADEVRELLRERSPEAVFWDWPGDTEVMLARK